MAPWLAQMVVPGVLHDHGQRTAGVWEGPRDTPTPPSVCWKTRFHITFLASRVNSDAVGLGPGPFSPAWGRNHEIGRADSPHVLGISLSGSRHCMSVTSHLGGSSRIGKIVFKD